MITFGFLAACVVFRYWWYTLHFFVFVLFLFFVLFGVLFLMIFSLFHRCVAYEQCRGEREFFFLCIGLYYGGDIHVSATLSCHFTLLLSSLSFPFSSLLASPFLSSNLPSLLCFYLLHSLPLSSGLPTYSCHRNRISSFSFPRSFCQYLNGYV